jgi:hypothetical protein
MGVSGIKRLQVVQQLPLAWERFSAMKWLRDNTDLIAIVALALAWTGKGPVVRVHADTLHHQTEVRAEFNRALAEARGEICRTLRTTTALHRYND